MVGPEFVSRYLNADWGDETIGPKLVARCANKMCSDKRNAAKTEDKSVTDHP